MIVLLIAVFGFIAYDSVKPPLPQPAEYTAMEQAPAVGDIYFGHYEQYREKGTPVGAKIGFGWFKVTKVEGNDYYLALSTQMSKTYLPKEELNSADFETENLPAVQVSEQTGYNLRFKSADELTEVYITDKK